jgi:hypothetical protein
MNTGCMFDISNNCCVKWDQTITECQSRDIKLWKQITLSKLHNNLIFNSICMFLHSCEIVALRENVDDRLQSYDSFSTKSWQCVFLAHGFGYISPFPNRQSAPKQGIKKFLCYLPTTRTITTLQSFTSLCHVTKYRDLEYMANDTPVGEKFKCGTFKAALNDVRYL